MPGLDSPGPLAQGPPARGQGSTGLGGTAGSRRLNWTMALGVALVAALTFIAYQILAGTNHVPGISATAGSRAADQHGSTGGGGTPTGKPTASASPFAHEAVVRVTAVRGSWVEFSTPGGKHLSSSYVVAGASQSWTFRRAVEMRLSNPDGIHLTVDGRNPVPPGSGSSPIMLSLGPGRPATVAPAAQPTNPSPQPSSPTRTLTPVSVSAFGGSGAGDNPQLAPLAVDGNPGTAWHTDWYTSARFGNLYAGTGLLLDMGRAVTVKTARITLGSSPGASFQLRVGTAPDMSHLQTVASASDASGVVHLRPASRVRGQYVLIWFTRLPPDAAGTFQASVHDVKIRGSS